MSEFIEDMSRDDEKKENWITLIVLSRFNADFAEVKEFRRAYLIKAVVAACSPDFAGSGVETTTSFLSIGHRAMSEFIEDMSRDD